MPKVPPAVESFLQEISSIMGLERYVVGFAFSDTRVLLTRKTKPAWQKGLLNGIGGLVEKGETIVEAMCREFQEEAFLVTKPGDWIHRVRLITYKKEKYDNTEYSVDFFLTYLDPKQHYIALRAASEATNEKLIWVQISNMCLMRIIPNLLWLIPLCRDADLDPHQTITVQDRRL